ncbi:DUF2063 domain-containing protein [Agaribacterium sp. ZY112]|uniref:HvfC family RiPP maturation protein n=1 Tax=Agaribacterium sp. ZY112 TaxID=3233574 RepID=UPI003525F0A6
MNDSSDNVSVAPSSLREFQLSFGCYLRDPQNQSRPDGVPERQSRVYEELLFNNISGFIDNCFPVAKTLFSELDWVALQRQFFSLWRCHTPIFSQIPLEFVHFTHEHADDISAPHYFVELLHYEWMELEVDLDEHPWPEELEDVLTLNPSARLLAYQWPVHTASADNKDLAKEPSFLAIWRTQKFNVSFSELNATTYMLLELLKEEPITLALLIEKVAQQLERNDIDALSAFAVPLLNEFIDAELIVGSC